MENSSEGLTIAKMVTLPRLKVFDQELSEFEETHEYVNKYPIVDKNTYVGIEIETENVSTFRHESPYWSMVEDGSLRNSGREFITPPIRAWRVERALSQLFTREINSTIEFSERTSVHVHMNIRTLTVEQLEALIITYLVFEKALFTFVGNNRYSNIFCVPIVETDIGENLLPLITDKHPQVSWQKYTALNLLPIMQKGTIEFRHMNGTNDIKHLITWINLILSLKKFALQKSPAYIWNRINTLNTTSEYRLFGEEVFDEYLQLLWNDEFNTGVADCITYVKQFCIKNPFRLELRNAFMTAPVSPREATQALDDMIEDWAEPRAPQVRRDPVTDRWITQFTEPTPETFIVNDTTVPFFVGGETTDRVRHAFPQEAPRVDVIENTPDNRVERIWNEQHDARTLQAIEEIRQRERNRIRATEVVREQARRVVRPTRVRNI